MKCFVIRLGHCPVWEALIRWGSDRQNKNILRSNKSAVVSVAPSGGLFLKNRVLLYHWQTDWLKYSKKKKYHLGGAKYQDLLCFCFPNYAFSFFLKDCLSISFSVYYWCSSLSWNCTFYSPGCCLVSSNFDWRNTAEVNPRGWKLPLLFSFHWRSLVGAQGHPSPLWIWHCRATGLF